ncbi:hypothetical protein KRMM14A1004_52780 [Krasilnikovia sp. MM14-A1004]
MVVPASVRRPDARASGLSATGGKGDVTRGTAAISSEAERVWEGRDIPETGLFGTAKLTAPIDNGSPVGFDVHEYPGRRGNESRRCHSPIMIPTTM